MKHQENENYLAPDVIQGDTPTLLEPVVSPTGDYLQGIKTAAGKGCKHIRAY